MPWYYIEVKHGGGHQSTTSKWVWTDKPAPIRTNDDIENFVEPYFDGYYFGGDSAIFTVKRVSKVPHKVKEGQICHYEATIAHAMKMIEVLNNTKTHPPRCTAQTSRFPGDPKSEHLLAQCNKDMGHRSKAHESQSRHNRERFGE